MTSEPVRAPVPAPGPSKALCLWMIGLSALVFALLCAFLVPWSWVPGGHVVDVRGSEVFTDAQLRRAHTYSSMQRHLGWASLAVSLAVALVLGLTRLGCPTGAAGPGPVVGQGAPRHAGDPARR